MSGELSFREYSWSVSPHQRTGRGGVLPKDQEPLPPRSVVRVSWRDLEASCGFANTNQVELRKRFSPFFLSRAVEQEQYIGERIRLDVEG